MDSNKIKVDKYKQIEKIVTPFGFCMFLSAQFCLDLPKCFTNVIEEIVGNHIRFSQETGRK